MLSKESLNYLSNKKKIPQDYNKQFKIITKIIREVSTEDELTKTIISPINLDPVIKILFVVSSLRTCGKRQFNLKHPNAMNILDHMKKENRIVLLKFFQDNVVYVENTQEKQEYKIYRKLWEQFLKSDNPKLKIELEKEREKYNGYTKWEFEKLVNDLEKVY